MEQGGMSLQAQSRAAAVALLAAYAAAQTTPIKLQVYPGRPRTINPPTAFVESISETVSYEATQIGFRTAEVEVLVLHGLFDSKDTSEQKDAFVDGFLAYVDDNVHAAGGTRTFGGLSTEDVPNYIPEWLQPELQRPYFATRITLQGFQGGFA